MARMLLERLRDRFRRTAPAVGCLVLLFAAAGAAGQPQTGEGAEVQIERRLLLPAAGAGGEPARSGAGPSVLSTVVSLGVVLGLIFGCAAAFRKLSGGGGGRGSLATALGRAGRAPSGLVEILARYPAGRGQTLVLLRVDRRVLLLSQSLTGRLGCSAAFTTLCEITEPEEVASILAKVQDEEGESMAARFRSLLGRFDEPGDALEEEGWLPRRPVAGEGMDRAELLDEHSGIEPDQAPLRLAREQHEASEAEGLPVDAVGSLRRRLETLRMAEGS